MINLKACARCGGDVMAEDYLGDIELVCLQCGHRTSAPVEARQPVYPIRRPRRNVSQKKAA